MKLTMRKNPIDPSSAAIIMANGIFLLGVIQAFPSFDQHFGKVLALFLFIGWLLIYQALTKQFFRREFLLPFIKHPVQSFSMGTWIAGVSVLCNVWIKYFPEMLWLMKVFALFNTFLWFLFLINCLYHFKKLFVENRNYSVHGVILLSTVGTQSTVILLNKTFLEFPVYLEQAMIIIGLLFYLICIGFITNRYLKRRNWTLVKDWSNTNCIIHGSLSITGLAMVTTHTFLPVSILCLWFLVLFMFIIVETIEIIRAIQRVKFLGFKRGLFSYDISQWSRNFTFGMFYAFTYALHTNPTYHLLNGLWEFQQSFLSVWCWVVLIVLLTELGLYAKEKGSFFLYSNEDKPHIDQ